MEARGPCSVLNEGTGGLSGCVGFCGVGGGGELLQSSEEGGPSWRRTSSHSVKGGPSPVLC